MHGYRSPVFRFLFVAAWLAVLATASLRAEIQDPPQAPRSGKSASALGSLAQASHHWNYCRNRLPTPGRELAEQSADGPGCGLPTRTGGAYADFRRGLAFFTHRRRQRNSSRHPGRCESCQGKLSLQSRQECRLSSNPGKSSAGALQNCFARSPASKFGRDQGGVRHQETAPEQRSATDHLLEPQRHFGVDRWQSSPAQSRRIAFHAGNQYAVAHLVRSHFGQVLPLFHGPLDGERRPGGQLDAERGAPSRVGRHQDDPGKPASRGSARRSFTGAETRIRGRDESRPLREHDARPSWWKPTATIEFASIDGTQLLWITNTDDDILYDTAGQNYYVQAVRTLVFAAKC